MRNLKQQEKQVLINLNLQVENYIIYRFGKNIK